MDPPVFLVDDIYDDMTVSNFGPTVEDDAEIPSHHPQNAMLLGWVAGLAYGVTTILVGQPLDTIKTRMQAMMTYSNLSMGDAAKRLARKEGVAGFYRGATPMLWGSMLYRSLQFGAYQSAYNMTEHVEFLDTKLPFAGHTNFRTVLAGMAGGAFRAVCECPFEYVKVNKQVDHIWQIRGLYTGFGITLTRTTTMFSVYITLLDVIKHDYPEFYSKPVVGPFVSAGVTSTIGWWAAWPMERIKSAKQAHFRMHGENTRKMSSWSVFRMLLQNDGIRGVYRGIWPGTLRGVIANGCAMVVMELVRQYMDTDAGVPGH